MQLMMAGEYSRMGRTKCMTIILKTFGSHRVNDAVLQFYLQVKVVGRLVADAGQVENVKICLRIIHVSHE